MSCMVWIKNEFVVPLYNSLFKYNDKSDVAVIVCGKSDPIFVANIVKHVVQLLPQSDGIPSVLFISIVIHTILEHLN